ncbi:MAG: hypothetical protein R3A51_16495 [Nannocystaceae bacterium]
MIFGSSTSPRALLTLLVLSACARPSEPTTPAPVAAVPESGESEPAAPPESDAVRRVRALHDAEPQDGASRYVLARYHASRGERAEALAMLEEMVAIEAWDQGLDLADFGVLADDPAVRRIHDTLTARGPKVTPSAVAFELDALDILPEGVAWDGRRRELLVGSMHKRQVLAADARGRTRLVVPPARDGLLGVLGIAVDSTRDQLWIVSTAAPFMQGYDEARDAGHSELVGVSLADGAFVGRWPAPASPAQINDVTVARDGTVYVTESASGAVLRRPPTLAPGAPLEVLTPAGALLGANGLALDADERSLYVCDFFGLHRVALETGERTRVAAPDGVQTLGGIDGLERQGDTLLAIQNLFGPGRVWALRLSADGQAITAARILDDAHPRYHGPTTGAVADGRFLYLADASLQFDGQTIAPARDGQRHAILSVPLPIRWGE